MIEDLNKLRALHRLNFFKLNSTARGQRVTHSGETNIGHLLKLYCRVFFNVLWVCVSMYPFEKGFLG